MSGGPFASPRNMLIAAIIFIVAFVFVTWLTTVPPTEIQVTK